MPNDLNKINKRIGRLYKISNKNLDRYTGGLEKQLIDTYKEGLDDIRSTLGKMHEKFGDKVDYKTMASYQRLQNMEKEFTDRLTKMGQKVKRITEKSIMENYSQAYYSTGYIHESALNVGMGFTAVSEDTLRASLINPYTKINWDKRLGKNTAYLIGDVKDNVTRGLRQGYGYAKSARAMRKTLEMGVYQALRIAQTESHRAREAGRLAGYDKVQDYCEEQDIKLEKVWLSTLDTRTRDSHKSMDGQIADKDGFFQLPGGKTEAPGNSGIAKEDINCRCTFVSRILDIPFEFRHDNIEKKKTKWKNYEDWQKKKKIPPLKKAA